MGFNGVPVSKGTFLHKHVLIKLWTVKILMNLKRTVVCLIMMILKAVLFKKGTLLKRLSEYIRKRTKYLISGLKLYFLFK